MYVAPVVDPDNNSPLVGKRFLNVGWGMRIASERARYFWGSDDQQQSIDHGH